MKESLRCRVVETVEGFLDLKGSWADLRSRANNPSPTSHWEWLWTWWSLFGHRCPKSGREGRPYVIVVQEEDRIVGIFPFFYFDLGPLTPRLRRLRPIGYAGELEPSGLTEECLTLVESGKEISALNAVVDFIAANLRRLRLDCAIVRQTAELAVPVPKYSFPSVIVSVKRKEGPQIVTLPSDWATFRKQLTKSMRDNLPYYPRLLKRDGHDFKFFYCRDTESIREAANDLVRLHKQRVFSEVGRTHQDYFGLPIQAEMLATGFAAVGEAGGGFLATLKVGDQCVAAQGFLEFGGEMVVHYSGFSPEFAKYSPLLVLQSEVFRHAMEARGVRRLNLLHGNAQWQKRWSAEAERSELRCLILRKNLPTVLRCGLYAFARETAAYYRRSGLSRLIARRTATKG
jgi:Acetyltransferase (GNAT) domain